MNVSQIQKLREVVAYNPESGEFTWLDAGKYHREKNGFPCGKWIASCPGKKPYLVIQIFGKKYRAQRLAWIMVYGIVPDTVDHIDGDTANNRISNLRNVSRLENAQNHLKHKSSLDGKKSGLPVGVKALKSGMFQARITASGKLISLGSFPNPEIAHQIYMQKRMELHDCPTIK